MADPGADATPVQALIAKLRAVNIPTFDLSFDPLTEVAGETLIMRAADVALYLHRRADELEAALAAVSPQGWQPIETAPKEDSRFLVWFPLSRVMHTIRRHLGEEYFYGPGGEEPSHWMPLPSPPRVAAGPEEP